MGGIMKGAYSSSSSSRRRWINVYVVMVIVCVVFGCGVLGLMGLHRLKERRILNLLIQEKNDQIVSLHRLLQKEREQMQEVKKKTEEMRMKIFNLRAQKSELNSRILDMQSTISSLRDEHRTIELAFQEKQNEAKLLREQYMEIKNKKPQLEALTETLQQKQAEIKDLKHRLQLDNEHSILPANITAKTSMSGSETTIDGNNMNDASRYREAKSSMQSEEHRENGRSINGTSETISKEKSERQERSENGRANADRGNEEVGGSETAIQKEEQKPRDEDSETHFTDGKKFSTVGDANARRISNARRSGDQDLEVHKGMVKFAMQENSHNGHYRVGGKRGYLKQAKGKRWRSIAKQTEEKRSSRSNGALTMGDQGLVEGTEEIGDKREEGKSRNHDKIQNTMRLQNESVTQDQQIEIDDKLLDAVQGEAMLKVKDNNSRNVIKPEQHTEDTSHKIAKFDESNQSKNGWEVMHTNSSSEKSHVSLDEQSKEQEITFTEGAENSDIQHDNRLGQNEIAERNEDPDGMQMEHLEKSEVGEDSEDKEQADEPEF